MAVVAVAIGFVGIKEIQSIEAGDTRLNEKMAVPLGYLAKMGMNFQQMRINIRNFEDAKTPEERNRI